MNPIWASGVPQGSILDLFCFLLLKGKLPLKIVDRQAHNASHCELVGLLFSSAAFLTIPRLGFKKLKGKTTHFQHFTMSLTHLLPVPFLADFCPAPRGLILIYFSKNIKPCPSEGGCLSDSM